MSPAGTKCKAGIIVVTDISCAVAQEIPRPRLAVSLAGETSLRPAQVHKNAKQFAFLAWCPRQESNLHYKHRKLASYPLNDEGLRANVTQTALFSTYMAVFPLRRVRGRRMIQVMSRGNSIVAGVVLIGILGTLSIALQATTPSTHSIVVSPASQRAAAGDSPPEKVVTVPAKSAAPQALGCLKGVDYTVRKVKGKNIVSCKPNGSCPIPGEVANFQNEIWNKDAYTKAGAEECYQALVAQAQSDTASGKNKDVTLACPAANADTCSLQQCFTKKDGKDFCVKIKGTFTDTEGFAPANNEAFGMRELVRQAAEGDNQAREALKNLKVDDTMRNGIFKAFEEVKTEYGQYLDKLKNCGQGACTEGELMDNPKLQAKQQEKLANIQKLNEELQKVGTITPPDDPAKRPTQPGDPAAGPAGPQNTPGPGQQPPTTGFGQSPSSGTQQKPSSSGASNPYQQCSPQYFCTNNTLYWGSQQQQQQSSYYPYYGSGCQNQIVQYCQYGCAQGNTACSQNPQNTGQTPVPTLTCGGNNTVLDVGATVPITFSCTNAASSAGSGFSTGGALSGSASAIIQKPPSGADVVSYGLTCTASNNQTASARCDVGINVTSIVMVANPKQVSANASTTIGWVTRGMKECVVHVVDAAEDSVLEAFNSENAENTAVSGIAVTPGLTDDTTFTLSCKTKTNQTKSANVTVKVE